MIGKCKQQSVKQNLHILLVSMIMALSSHQSSMMVTAAAAAVAATGLLLWHSRRCKTDSSDLMIPSELLKSPYSKELKLAVQLARKGIRY
jgi:hypothetical protein